MRQLDWRSEVKCDCLTTVQQSPAVFLLEYFVILNFLSKIKLLQYDYGQSYTLIILGIFVTKVYEHNNSSL